MQESSKQDQKAKQDAAAQSPAQVQPEKTRAEKTPLQQDIDAVSAEAAKLMAQADQLREQSAAQAQSAKAEAGIEEKTAPQAEEAKPQSAPAEPERVREVYVKGGGAGAGVYIICLILAAAIAGLGFYGHQQIEELKTAGAEVIHSRSGLEEAQRSLSAAQSEISSLIAANTQMQSQNRELLSQNEELRSKLASVAESAEATAQSIAAVHQRLDRYEARDPNEWRIAESYFNVSEAARQAVFGHNVKAAVWNLQQADNLLVNLQDDRIVDIRAAIAQDLSTLKALPEIDLTGISIKLEQLYRDTENLVVIGASDPEKRAHAFDKNSEPSSDIMQWKENLISSAKEFSSRFVQVSRRGPDAVLDFLSPEQVLFLRENIRTRLLLARASLSGGVQQDYDDNLAEAVRLVEAYFDPESGAVKAFLTQLQELQNEHITPDIPRALESLRLFDKLAQERLPNIQG